MKNLLFSFFFLASVSHAAPLTVNVKDFNFTYKNPHGEGSAASFSRSGDLSKNAIKVSVDKVAEDFKLTLSGAESQEIDFKNAPAFMTNAETMTVGQFNLSLQDKVSLTLGQGRFNSKDDSLGLDNVALNCARDNAQKEVMDQLIAGCIQTMSLKSSKFSSSSAEASIASLLTHTVALAAQDGVGLAGGVGVNGVDLSMSAGKFNLSAEVKAQVSGKVKSSGNMSYDVKSGVLTIKISEVKFGILSIKGKVFDELKKNESETLKVNEPYVYYTIK